MEIIVTVKNVYGEEKIYPVCKQAQLFAAIAGTKTLTSQTLRLVKQLGYHIQVSNVKSMVLEAAFN